MIYDLVASAYDKINSGIDYSEWADFIEKMFIKYSKSKPELVLDLGCGTGTMTVELASRGYDMTGIDYSDVMLSVARYREQIEKPECDVLWLCQDITEFELYGTVDAAVCCLDTVNHIYEPKKLDKMLSLVHNYLIPDGLFIFDVNGKARFEKVYGSNTYVYDENGEFCIWQNSYNEKTRLCDFLITVFAEEDDGRYERSESCQTERMYTVRSLKSALKRSGFEFVGAYSDYNFTEASDESDRIYFVARCIKNMEI